MSFCHHIDGVTCSRCQPHNSPFQGWTAQPLGLVFEQPGMTVTEGEVLKFQVRALEERVAFLEKLIVAALSGKKADDGT